MKQALISLAMLFGLSSVSDTTIKPFVLEDKDCIKYESKDESIIKTKNDTKKETKNEKELNREKREWFFLPTPPKEIEKYKKPYNVYYEGDNKKKELYLTFDCGYENGVTNKILDVLKKNNVKAAFFVTGHYLDTAPEIVKRMEKEGHIVGNHTENHPSLAKISKNNNHQLKKELESAANKYKKITGKEMQKFMRPPMGEFSEASLSYTNDLGYKSIFWNCAYKDYDIKNQMNFNEAKKVINDRFRDGGIVLLHVISKTNAEILDQLINDWKNKGYEFKTLNDLPKYE